MKTSLPETRTGTALLVIDVQKSLFEKSIPIYQAGQLLDTICTLAERAHTVGVPVIYIQHSNDSFLLEGTDGWQLHPRLTPQENDILLRKKHGNAFEDTDLDAQLEAKNIGTLVISGLVTHGCVRATCLGAHELGYRVILVADGHSSYHKKAAALITEWNQKLGEVTAEVKLAAEIEF